MQKHMGLKDCMENDKAKYNSHFIQHNKNLNTLEWVIRTILKWIETIGLWKNSGLFICEKPKVN